MDGWMDEWMDGWMDGCQKSIPSPPEKAEKQLSAFGKLGKSMLICRVGLGTAPGIIISQKHYLKSLKKEVVVGIASETRGWRAATPSGQERTTSGVGKDS